MNRWPVIALVLLIGSARADIDLGTRRFAVSEAQRDDQPTACTISFTQLLQDTDEAGGGFVQIEGTVTLATRNDGALGWTLRLTPGDLRLAGGRLGTIPFEPDLAYLAGSDFTTLGHETERPPCDGIGFCAVYLDDETVSGLMTLLADPGGFRVGYRRRHLGADVITQVVDGNPDGGADLDRFGDCTLALFGDALGAAHGKQ